MEKRHSLIASSLRVHISESTLWTTLRVFISGLATGEGWNTTLVLKEYFLGGELRHIPGEQLGVRTSRCVILVPMLNGMGKSSTFSTYVLHLDIFSNSICIQRQATTPHTASSAPASPGKNSWGRLGSGTGALSLRCSGVLASVRICYACIL